MRSMAENEKLPYKKQWKKKYLKQLCGFANSNGGSIYIEDASVKDPSLTAAMQAEMICKKVEQELGIPAMICETQIQGVRCLEIGVAPSMRPVAYAGYYYSDGPKGIQRLEGLPLAEMISEKFDALEAARLKELNAQKKKKSVDTKKKHKKEKKVQAEVTEAICEDKAADSTEKSEAIPETAFAENTRSDMAEEAVVIEKTNMAAERLQMSRADLMEEKLLALFEEDPYMKQETAAEKLGISLRTVKRIVRALTDAKRLMRTGGRRYGHWEIPGEDSAN